jgi:8-oxo-dGTP pyrophosphatase MutT (NUDIX family)
MKEEGASSVGDRPQVAALPFRRQRRRGLEVMLVTSRETRRWVIPKGWPVANLKPYAAAEREAFEEAGLVGRIAKKPVGRYAYRKRLKSRGTVTCTVDVFPFEVRRQLKQWPEKDEREGRWFTPDEAAKAVEEPDLAEIIRHLDEQVTPSSARPGDDARPSPAHDPPIA